MQAMMATLGSLPFFQTRVEAFEDGVALNRREHRHEHHRADAVTASSNTSLAIIGAAFAVHRSDADQGSDLLAIELAEPCLF